MTGRNLSAGDMREPATHRGTVDEEGGLGKGK